MSMTTPRPMRRRRSGHERQKTRAGWLLILPAFANITVFLGIPLVMAVVLSFTDFSFYGAFNFIGIQNYSELIGDENFQVSVVNTIIYTVAVVPLAMGLALLVALGVNAPIKGRAVFRVIFYIPVVTATVSIATVWLWIFNPDLGLANIIGGLFGLPPSRWLASPSTALGSLILVGIWQGLGTKMVVYLAALQNVNPELVEAARLDGANRWHVFRYVTWPALGPAHFFVFVTSIIASFQVFDLVYVTTQGGPANATRVLTYDIFQNAFGALKLGYASAESVFMFILIAVFILVGLRLQRSNADGN